VVPAASEKKAPWSSLPLFRSVTSPTGRALPLPDAHAIREEVAEHVARADGSDGRRLEALRWGLIPFWPKDAKIAYSTINAMAATA
jgi:putative SOS response-associated peptidase YedK